MNVFPRGTRSEIYYVEGILPTTVFAVFRAGRFATDIYAWSGISGAPVIDMSSGRVIGVCSERNRQFEPYKSERVSVPTGDGTTVTMPALWIVYNYQVARSVASAREFLADAP